MDLKLSEAIMAGKEKGARKPFLGRGLRYIVFMRVQCSCRVKILENQELNLKSQDIIHLEGPLFVHHEPGFYELPLYKF